MAKKTPLQKAIHQYVKETPSLKLSLDRHNADESNVAVSGLPAKYDNVEACLIVNGKWCYTVGEYKRELEKYMRFIGTY